MTDLSTTIAAKSDQLNADDLMGGPIDIEITKVRGCAEPDQPVAIHYVGDEGKPFKPCKTVRRVLVFVWGPKGDAYVGRRMRLYRDNAVKFGGIEVGGIRISHMSHIEGETSVAVMVTRGKKAPYKVLPLKTDAKKPAAAATSTLTLDERAASFIARVKAAAAPEKLAGIWAASQALRDALAEEAPDLLIDVTSAFKAREAEIAGDTEEPA